MKELYLNKLQMKKIVYILSVVFAGFIMSCEDILEAPSKSTLDESTIYSNPELASRAIVGILEPIGQTNSYRGRFLTHFGANTDIEWINSTAINGRGDLSRYINSPTNVDMNGSNNVWAMIYVGIERANLCIRGIRTYGNPAPDNEMGQLLGEALTYRAIYYADLLKTWGDVIARFEPVTADSIYVKKSDRGVIYKQIIADLEEAATLVAWPNETARTSNSEGINKAFVKAFRARLCLMAAGFSLYPQGGIRRSNDPELSVATLYPIALQECKDVIESGHAQLEPTFEGFFRKVCEEVISTGGESLWEIPFADGRGRMAFTFAVNHQTTDQYQANGDNRGGVFGPLPNVYYDFDVKDTRRDVTCVPYRYGNATYVNNVLTVPAKQELVGLDNWYFGKYRYDWMNRRVTSSNDDGLNKVYMRYAEVLLMAAEIENELNGPAAAAPYLKQIRQRAFDPADWSEKVDAYVDALSSKEDMFNGIVTEHGLEFCGEMLRKQALIRWNLLKTKMDETKTKMYALRDRSGDYTDVPSTLYYDYVADDEGRMTDLVIYGLNRGETEVNPFGYANSVTWVDATKLTDVNINSIYAKNPDQYQFWPIWQYFLDNSNGMLVNDYGY
jgi:hypothetical protein